MIVRLKDQANQQPVLAAVSEERVLRRYEHFPLLAMQVGSEGIAQLASSAHVTGIQEDPIGDPGLASTIPLIGADRAHTRGFTGTGQTVAVLDTGIDRDHPFFGNRIVDEACFSNPMNTTSQQSLCPNGQTTQTGAGSADAETARCLNGTANLCAHGTHVAGIAAGGAGVAGSPGPGVAPAATIIAIQIFVRFNSGCPGGNNPCVRYFGSDLLAGLDRVFDLRNNFTIAAANMSVYEGAVQTAACDTDNRKAAVDRLLNAGIAAVMIAGNEADDPGVRAPGCISTAVTVGNSTDNDAIANSSGRGPLLDLFAPGTSVDSSVPDDAWANFNGTSMAAPHVAGAFAVMRQAFPGEGVNQILNRLRAAGVAITYTTGGQQVTTPRLDLGAALPPNQAPQVSIDPGQVKEIDEGQEVTARANFTDAPADGPFTGQIEWGFGDLDPGAVGDGTLTGARRYGDNGSFDVTMSVTDKEGATGSAAFPLTVKNVAPTAAIDESAAVPVNGTPTFVGPRQGELQLKARITDPGSDDLENTWTWGDGTETTTTSLVDPPDQDPLPSPDVQPRDLTDTGTHAWPEPCLYDVKLTAADDDGGAAEDTGKILVTGAYPHRLPTAYWVGQYRPGPRIPTDLPVRVLTCYLDIAQYASKVFSEAVDASTRDKARRILATLSISPRDRLDAQLLTAWLNFANGSVAYTQLVDTDFNFRPETKFADAAAAAETVRLNPNASAADLLRQMRIMEWINLGF
ncbi:S8 family peptidase [Nonomuraea typhae]|uniref:S8 family peptidase n=1 Tax=Nonomuraea typhae TaxID=2603600 RepID=A0ABW7YYQ6_9ACTN